MLSIILSLIMAVSRTHASDVKLPHQQHHHSLQEILQEDQKLLPSYHRSVFFLQCMCEKQYLLPVSAWEIEDILCWE